MAWSREEMVRRLAEDVDQEWSINLGTGLPTAVADHLHGVTVESENGILGVGPRVAPGDEDPDLVDAGKNHVTILPGAAFMDSSMSFALIRGGRIDLSVMGAFQVSQRGDLANWRQPDSRVAGIGGAADLAIGAARVWVLMTHQSKGGEAKLVDACAFPLTAPGVVKRVYTDLGVFVIEEDAFTAIDLAPGVTLEEVMAATSGTVRDGVG